MSTIGLVASLAMAVGAPLIYADQAYSIQKKRSSTGFSKDVCAVLLLANIARCFWWLSERFELPLLLQSVLMIISQLGLLGLLLKYREGSYASSAFTSSSEDYAGGRDPGPAGARGGPARGARPSTTAGQGQSGERESLRSSQPEPAAQGRGTASRAPAPDAGFAALFSGSSSRGGYAPVLSGLHLPTLPYLEPSSAGPEVHEEVEEEEEEDQEPTSLLTRTTRRAHKVARRRGTQLKTLLGVRSDGSLRQDGSSSSRPLGFWTWTTMPSYLAFLFLYCLLLLFLHLIFSSSSTYNSLLGLYALGLESALPLPQLLANQRRRSLSGFRLSVLAGWLFGDLFKTAYFLFRSSPWPFLLGGCFALAIDVGIVVQSRMFQEQTEKDDREEEERKRADEALRLEEEAAAAAYHGGVGVGAGGADVLDVSSRRRRDEDLDQDLEDDALLFDSAKVDGMSGKGRGGAGAGAAGGGDLSSGSKVFTIEADED
ncbi:hypothetical protein BCV69DRAFT_283592 [Microstroma glucosiphilum]|uniref:PQ-loop-domain-containing protein n=1 Tax=Pseudomicrostroma glucosiphilum TaxID=1684307 RepID=A0A316U456_9BASI|nr:hypothetical protein BCV69DRAFT_283592 [Pseudomicrostroma glucosiphilum]PWN20059.1 hypothetical protein BCV69DRAFT_283592 [Pseudomicrostroma glucosiphilum]